MSFFFPLHIRHVVGLHFVTFFICQVCNFVYSRMSCNSVSGSNISSIVLLSVSGGSDMHDEEDQLVD